MRITQRHFGAGIAVFGVILFVFLAMLKAGVDEENAFLCEAVHSNPNMNMSQCPVHKTNSSWYLTASFALSMLVVASGIFVFFFPFAKLSDSGMKPDLSKLDEEERVVYEILKNSEGSAYQSDIIRESGFSKVKVTRILDRLEGKRVVERKRRGMTNIVILR